MIVSILGNSFEQNEFVLIPNAGSGKRITESETVESQLPTMDVSLTVKVKVTEVNEL